MTGIPKRRVGWWLGAALLIGSPVCAQWQPGSLAVRTSGSVLRSGECLRVELLALEAVPASFTFQLTYRFTDQVTVRDDEGKDRVESRERTIARPAGPVIEQVDRFQAIVLDDTLCFGEGTPPGRYLVEVALAPAAAARPSGQLRSCIVFDDGGTRNSGESCSFFLRGLARVEGADSLVFDGNFSDLGMYRAVMLRGDRVQVFIDGGIVPNGPHEIIIIAPGLRQSGSDTFDLVLHDQTSGSTTTLGRVVLPPPR